jgi:hypothetical protein
MMRDKRGVPLVLGERTGTKGGHASVKSPTETNDERQKGGPLVPGERTRTKGGHASARKYLKIPGRPPRHFSREIYTCAGVGIRPRDLQPCA